MTDDLPTLKPQLNKLAYNFLEFLDKSSPQHVFDWSSLARIIAKVMWNEFEGSKTALLFDAPILRFFDSLAQKQVVIVHTTDKTPLSLLLFSHSHFYLTHQPIHTYIRCLKQQKRRSVLHVPDQLVFLDVMDVHSIFVRSTRPNIART